MSNTNSFLQTKVMQCKTKIDKIPLLTSLCLVCTVLGYLCLSSCSSTNTSLLQDTVQTEKVSEHPDKELRSSSSLMPDLPLINQNQEQVYFHRDLIKGKTVAINFVYTTCKSICTLQGRNFAKVQDLLGERLGKDIYLITITKDPTVDTSEKITAWSQNYNPKPGWDILTGKPDDVTEIVRPFIGGFSRQMEHSPVIFIINEEKGVRKSIYGLTAPEGIAELLINTADSLAPYHPVNTLE